MLLYNDNTIDLFYDIGRRNCVCAVVNYGREQKNSAAKSADFVIFG